MSIIGISPSDIVAGIKTTHKAAKALTEGDDGARTRYQYFKRTIAHRGQAVQDCFDELGSSSPSLQDNEVSQLLLDEDHSFLTSQSSYESKLGRGAHKRWSHGIVEKVKYAFDGDKKATRHVDDTQPLVHAALFRALRHLADSLRTLHRDMKTGFDQVSIIQDSVALRGRLDEGCDDLFRQMAAALKPNQPRVLPHDRPGQPSTPATKTPQSMATKRPPTRRRIKGGSATSRKRGSNSVGKVQARAEQCGQSTGAGVHNDRPNQIQRTAIPNNTLGILNPSGDLCLPHQHRKSELLGNGIYMLAAVVATLAYRNGEARKFALSILKESQKDPIMGILFACAIVTIAKCLFQLPQQISLLGDDSITLETALGDHLRVPSCYWRASEIFHGFVEWHFKDRPGATLVVGRRYRILIGGVGGVVVDDSKWNVVSKRMRLTMAMVLAMVGDMQRLCPRCKTVLEDRSAMIFFCRVCNREFSTVAEDVPNVEKVSSFPDNTEASTTGAVDARAARQPQLARTHTAISEKELLAFANILLARLRPSSWQLPVGEAQSHASEVDSVGSNGHAVTSDVASSTTIQDTSANTRRMQQYLPRDYDGHPERPPRDASSSDIEDEIPSRRVDNPENDSSSSPHTPDSHEASPIRRSSGSTTKYAIVDPESSDDDRPSAKLSILLRGISKSSRRLQHSPESPKLPRTESNRFRGRDLENSPPSEPRPSSRDIVFDSDDKRRPLIRNIKLSGRHTPAYGSQASAAVDSGWMLPKRRRRKVRT